RAVQPAPQPRTAPPRRTRRQPAHHPRQREEARPEGRASRSRTREPGANPRRHSPCKRFYSGINGGAKGIRTPDLFHAMEARYQLRHSPALPCGSNECRRSGRSLPTRARRDLRRTARPARAPPLPAPTSARGTHVVLRQTPRGSPRAGGVQHRPVAVPDARDAVPLARVQPQQRADPGADRGAVRDDDEGVLLVERRRVLDDGRGHPSADVTARLEPDAVGLAVAVPHPELLWPARLDRLADQPSPDTEPP